LVCGSGELHDQKSGTWVRTARELGFPCAKRGQLEEVHVANFSGVARCARYYRKAISSGFVKHTIAGLCNDLRSLRDYQMACLDVCDFSLSLGIDRHQIATVSSNLLIGLSNSRLPLCYHGLFVGYSSVISAQRAQLSHHVLWWYSRQISSRAVQVTSIKAAPTL
jgi:hypothetical protein